MGEEKAKEKKAYLLKDIKTGVVTKVPKEEFEKKRGVPKKKWYAEGWAEWTDSGNYLDNWGDWWGDTV